MAARWTAGRIEKELHSQLRSLTNFFRAPGSRRRRKKTKTRKQTLFDPTSRRCNDSNENSVTKPPSGLTFTSTYNVTSKADQCFVFTPPKLCSTNSTGKEPLPAPTTTNRQQLRDALVQSIVKCRLIQTSLYRIVLLKFRAYVTAVTDDQTCLDYCHLSAFTTERSTRNGGDTAGNLFADDVAASGHDASKVLGTTSVGVYSEKNKEHFGHAADDICAVVENTEVNLEFSPEGRSSKSPSESDISKPLSVASDGENPNHASKNSTSEQGTERVPCDNIKINESSVNSKASRLDKPIPQSQNDTTSALLCGLKEPLVALERCTEILRSLFHKFTNTSSSEEPVLISKHKEHEELSSNERSELCRDREELAHFLVLQSKFEEMTLKKKVDCIYARNPYCNGQHIPATSEDILQGTNVQSSFRSGASAYTKWCSRNIPHGHGTLKTSSGEHIYSGDWCRGKRHGNGEGVIFSLTAASHGVYCGQWKHNMRHGYGKMKFFTGPVYEGQWKFDKMTGFGTLKLPDGTIQEGTWKEGSLHGCAVFTWPHGVSEYREYDASRGQLTSCAIKERADETVSIENVTGVIHAKHLLRKEVSALKRENAEIHKYYQEQLNRNYEKQRIEADKALKAAEESRMRSAEEAAELKRQLEEAKGAVLCQICFTRPRDCIILPCSHFLYCRVCVNEHKSNGDSRCPTCRGTINSEIMCNVYHPL
ncbi:uncharacterized protein [Montipora foliosa]|uniref:uncharacterized protein n=1 Tax=Montipora foliosa TaxID=591990 RepID=UPI0035F1B7F5